MRCQNPVQTQEKECTVGDNLWETDSTLYPWHIARIRGSIQNLTYSELHKKSFTLSGGLELLHSQLPAQTCRCIVQIAQQRHTLFKIATLTSSLPQKIFPETHPPHLHLALPRFHAPPGTNSSQAYHTSLAIHPLHTVVHPRTHNTLSASKNLHPPSAN